MSRIKKALPAVVLLLTVPLAGCSGTSATTSSAPNARHSASATPPASPTPAPAPSAAEVVKTIAAKIPQVRAGKVYTAANDPNHLLGRPNGYTSKADCQDSRYHVGKGNWACSVEVFKTHAEAVARMNYISGVEKSAPVLGTEYMTVRGPVLLRVSGTLTPAQAAKYKAAAFGSR